ncbi:protease complex subunit PrcB family protein [Cytobacillus sp. FJAT-54145]|uniref:Protease complex subunit PrcB family protein n=1 Tax=Cytobacillus spartinae TaxID=3299023 RepID=A0ABW6KDE4_9BACI
MLASLILLLAFGSAASASQLPGSPMGKSISKSKFQSIPYLMETEEALPDEIKQGLLPKAEKRGIFSQTVGDKTYILASLGEQTSGGHSIAIERIYSVSPAVIMAQAKHTSPKKDDMVMQVLTTPYVVVSIPATSLAVKGTIVPSHGIHIPKPTIPKPQPVKPIKKPGFQKPTPVITPY